MGGLTRREVLVGVAAAAAAASCGRGGAKDALQLPPGELVGPDPARAHRLRDPRAAASATTRKKIPILIIGGGVAGLAAAWRLRRAGVDDFELVELDSVLGGTARADDGDPVAYPWGAHYVTAPFPDDRAMVAVLEEVGAITGRAADGTPELAEEMVCRELEERVFHKGRWVEGLYLHAGASADDLRQLAAFQAELDRWSVWRDAKGRRAFTTPVARCSDDAAVTALDRITMATWLDERKLTSSRLRWWVDYACRDDYGARPDVISAWAGLFYFVARLAAPGADPQPVITWPEGNGRLARHLARAVEGRATTGVLVRRVEPTSAGPVLVDAEDAAGAPIAFEADRVILAAPVHVAERILVRPVDAPGPELAAFSSAPWMVANLHLSARPKDRGAPLAWDNVLYEGAGLGYVCATHQRGLDRGPTTFTYYLPLVDADPRTARATLLAGGRDVWARTALDDLSRAHRDLARLVTRVDVMRWGHGMVRPTPGLIWGPQRARAAAAVGHVHRAHTDLSGIALFEEALDHGVRAAEEVLAARGVSTPSLRT